MVKDVASNFTFLGHSRVRSLNRSSRCHQYVIEVILHKGFSFDDFEHVQAQLYFPRIEGSVCFVNWIQTDRKRLQPGSNI